MPLLSLGGARAERLALWLQKRAAELQVRGERPIAFCVRVANACGENCTCDNASCFAA